MDIVTEFDSSLPLESTDDLAEKPEVEYGRVFEALSHDLEVAENVFTRASKRHVQEGLYWPFRRVSQREVEDIDGVWVSTSSVSVKFVADGNDDLKKLKHAIERLAQTTLANISCSCDGNRLILIDSLTASIKVAAQDRYRFSVKQRWSWETINGGA